MNGVTEFLNSTGGSFVRFALPMLIQSSVLIVILLGLDFLLRKKVRAVFRYCLWMLVLVKLVLPTTLSSPTGANYWIGGNLSDVTIEAPVTSELLVKTPPSTEPIIKAIPGETAEATPR